MRRRHHENGGEDGCRHDRTKLRALAALGRQLKLGNIFRLSKIVLAKIRLALRDVLAHDDDHAGDHRIAELLGVVINAVPNCATELPAGLANAVREDLVSLITDDEMPD